MWSRFRRLAFESPVSTTNLLKSTTSICAAASLVDWIQQNESDFIVPTFEQLQEANDPVFECWAKIISRGGVQKENSNLHFFQKYKDIIDESESTLADISQREILVYKPQIIEQISGRYGLKSKIVVEIGTGTGIFVPNIQSAIRIFAFSARI